MQCPRCKFEHESQTTECLKCGIVFAKYRPASSARSGVIKARLEDGGQAEKELWLRVFAVPGALAIAHLLVRVAPGPVRLLTMWVHELGHAVTAWLCGFWAIPGPWLTPVSEERSFAVTALAVTCIGFWGFELWSAQRRLMVLAASAVLLMKFACTLLPVDRAQALIIFAGDGGCMVLGSLLMLTLYARKESALYQNSLRWGFLPIGALSLMDAFNAWSRGEDNIPFGVQEGNLTDPSKLVESYGWPIHVMTDRYVHLAAACFAALGVAYIAGIVAARRRRRDPGKSDQSSIRQS